MIIIQKKYNLYNMKGNILGTNQLSVANGHQSANNILQRYPLITLKQERTRDLQSLP